MPAPTRRALLTTASATAILSPCLASAQGAALILEPTGAARRLPDRLVGASVEAMVEPMLDDPRKLEALKPLHLAFSRFPGGSQANFYDWHSGQLAIPMRPNSSPYRKFWADVAPRINRAFPGGVHYERYLPFSQTFGAEPVFVPNLETSTPADQAAWLKALAGKGIAPRYVEMGNEFYLAMLDDPDSMARWSDPATTQKIIRQYVDVLRPWLPADARIATQASDEGFSASRNPDGPFAKRMARWNDGLGPEVWFDAVTIHPYCPVANLSDATDTTDVAQARRLFDAVLAHYDQGLDRSVRALAARVPGKDIWVTEWNPRGGEPRYVTGSRDTISQAIAMQAIARAHFALLRTPAVTMMLYFMMNFSPQRTPFGVFAADGHGGFAPLPAALAVGWFAEAANRGATYQSYGERGAARIAGGGRLQESYAPVEAAAFRGRGTTMLVQNASAAARQPRMPAALPATAPTRVETMAMPDLANPSHAPAQVAMLPASREYTLPAYSLTRLIWA